MAEVAGVLLQDQEASAIEALGSLFKLTEVYLWDDGTREGRQPLSSSKSPRMNDDICTEFDLTPSDSVPSECSPSYEEMDLILQMNALGLPVSFQTKKEDNPTVSSCSVPMLGQSELSSYDVSADAPALSYSFNEGELTNLIGKGYDSIKELVAELPVAPSTLPICQSVGTDVLSRSDLTVERDNNFEIQAFSDRHSTNAGGDNVNDELVESLSGTNCNSTESPKPLLSEEAVLSSTFEGFHVEESVISKGGGPNGDWMVCWDTFYQRNYFYNMMTQVSTWFPPPGMEHESFVQNTYKSDEITDNANRMLAELSEAEVGPDVPSSCLKSADSLTSENHDRPIHDSVNDLISPGEPPNEFSFDTICGTRSEPDMATFTMDISMMNLDQHQGIDSRWNDEGMMCFLSDNEKIGGGEGDNNTGNLGNASSEVLGCSSVINDLHEVASEVTVLQFNDLDTEVDPHVKKQKKRTRKPRADRKFSNADEELKVLLEEYSADIEKYWHQRYLLFSKFDEGVKMDEEGWFSATPESIAKHHALRCGNGTIIDGFTGVGGNAIQFAGRAKHVIAVDIDPKKIEYARNNAFIYEVDDRIDFVNGNFFHLAPKLKADTVFLSPPWGGPDYTKVKTYDIRTMLKPHDGFFLFNVAKEIASKIVMFLPKNVDLNQLAELSLSANPPWSLEVEKNFLNGKLKAITAYFIKPEATSTR